MGNGKITLTREGYNKIQEELEYLRGQKRRQIAQDIAEARAQGDISENAEYDAAKEAQAMNEKKISEMQDVLVRAQIMDETNIATDQALLGATVKVRDHATGEEIDYMLVSEEESDFDMNKISTSSPVGEALLGRKVGEIVEVNVPVGVIQYEIVKISR